MLKITKKSASRLDIELGGTVDADDMRTALDELIEKSEGVSRGRMLYTISDFSFPRRSHVLCFSSIKQQEI